MTISQMWISCIGCCKLPFAIKWPDYLQAGRVQLLQVRFRLKGILRDALYRWMLDKNGKLYYVKENWQLTYLTCVTRKIRNL